MNRVRILAASARPLVEMLIDAVRASLKPRVQNLRISSSNDSDRTQFDLWVEDEPDDEADEGPVNILRPDDVAAAVLLGRALDRQRDALARLRDPDTVAIVEVPNQDFVEPIAKLLRNHVLGSCAPVLNDDALSNEATIADTGTVVIFKRKNEDKSKKSSTDDAQFLAAVQQRCAIIGIAAEPDRLLPRSLVRLAEHRIVVPVLETSAVAAVIEAVTGRRPAAIDDEIARRATLEALAIAVRADLGAERSLVRLTRLIGGHDASVKSALRLSEMHGLGAAKKFGLDLAADLRAYAAGMLPWSAISGGLIISGPPGTGKTSYARSLCREAGVYFIPTSYSAWQSHKEGHLGNVTAAIRKTFAEARDNRPCIVFIDEIDSLPARGSGDRHDDWWTAINNVLLEQIDGFERREGVVILAACNDPARLDAALVRSGRLDRHIAIPLPDVPALMGIFRTHLGAELEGADLRAAALAARGRTGADIERWVREARRTARTAGRALSLDDLLDAVRGGEPDWPADLRRRVAYHEAGHALTQLFFGIAEPKALSIGGGGGLAESDLGEIQAQTRSHMEKFLVALLAGRAAEQLAFGEPTAGAGGSEDSDLARATLLATRLETAYGLGNLGLVCIPGDNNRDLLLFGSLRTAVGSTLDRAYAAATELLNQNRHELDALANALFAAGYLDRSEIDAVLAKAPLHTKEATGAPTVSDTQQPHTDHGDIGIAGADAPSFCPTLITEV